MAKALLDIDDLVNVQTEVLKIASKWKPLSGKLGIANDLLDTIEADNHGKCDSCLKIALQHWLKQNYDVERHGFPCWSVLCTAVASPVGGQDKKLAQNITAKYNTCTDQFKEKITVDKEHCPYGCGCGNCTITSIVYEGCPTPQKHEQLPIIMFEPAVNVSTLSDLKQETVRIHRKFLEIVYTTWKHLKQNKVPVKEITTRLEVLLMTTHDTSVLNSITNYRDLLRFMSTCTSWFNYKLMEVIVKEFLVRNADLLGMWQLYKTELREYASQRIEEYEGVKFGQFDSEHHKIFLLKIDPSVKIKLCDIFDMQATLCEILEVPQLYFAAVHCSMVTLQFLVHIEHLPQLLSLSDVQKEFLKALEISEIEVEDNGRIIFGEINLQRGLTTSNSGRTNKFRITDKFVKGVRIGAWIGTAVGHYFGIGTGELLGAVIGGITSQFGTKKEARAALGVGILAASGCVVGAVTGYVVNNGTAAGANLGALAGTIAGGLILVGMGSQALIEIGIGVATGTISVVVGAVCGAVGGAISGRFTGVGMATGVQAGAALGAVNAGLFVIVMGKGNWFEKSENYRRNWIVTPILGATSIITGATALGAMLGGITGIGTTTGTRGGAAVGAGIGAMIGGVVFLGAGPYVAEIVGNVGILEVVFVCIEGSICTSVGAAIGRATEIGLSKGATVGVMTGGLMLVLTKAIMIVRLKGINTDEKFTLGETLFPSFCGISAAIGAVSGAIIGKFTSKCTIAEAWKGAQIGAAVGAVFSGWFLCARKNETTSIPPDTSEVGLVTEVKAGTKPDIIAVVAAIFGGFNCLFVAAKIGSLIGGCSENGAISGAQRGAAIGILIGGLILVGTGARAHTTAIIGVRVARGIMVACVMALICGPGALIGAAITGRSGAIIGSIISFSGFCFGMIFKKHTYKVF